MHKKKGGAGERCKGWVGEVGEKEGIMQGKGGTGAGNVYGREVGTE